MQIRRIKTPPAIEIIKTVNERNADFMKAILHVKQILEFDRLIY